MAPALLAAAAALTLWVGGYLFGAARGRAARAGLRAALDAQAQTAQSTTATARTELSEAHHRLERLEASLTEARAAGQEAERRLDAELRARRRAIESNDRSVETLREALAASEAEQRFLRERFKDIRPLLERSGPSAKQYADLEERINERLAAQGDVLLERLVSEAIGPLRERAGALAESIRPLREEERVTASLAQLRAGNDRGDLNQLLSEIAQRAGLALVTLADANGLLLANSVTGARKAELRAGLSALVLTIADSTVQVGAPKPLAMTVHDTENQLILTRIFEVDGERFLLTAVSKGRFVQPNVLDPALEKIETLMEDWAAAQVYPNARLGA